MKERNVRSEAISSLLALSAALGFAGAFCGTAADASVLADENTVILMRVGDGSTALSSSTAAVYLEEYAITYTNRVPTGATHVQTIPVNNLGAANTKLTIGGTASLEGGLNRSADGNYFVFTGYDQLVGAAASGSNARRMAGRVDLNGLVELDAIYGTGTTSANNAFRSITSLTGGEYWLATSATSTGVSYRPWAGGNDSLTLSSLLAGLNSRRVEVYNGQLYVGTASGSVQGVATVGSGTPTSGAQTVTILPGMPTTAGPSTVDFFFADDSTLYVADDRTSTSGGLQKWIFDGTNWNLAFTKNISTSTTANALRGLSGALEDNGVVTLFGTSSFGTSAVANHLIGISDTLGNTDPNNVVVNALASSASVPTASGALTTFRGLDVIGINSPEPGSFALTAAGLAFLLARRRS